MATYLELKEKAEKLLQEAEELRLKEIEQVIADIKEKIRTYGLSAQDLGLAGSTGPRRRKAAAERSSAPAKYRGPNGETWSGGRGRKPQWVVDALKKGEDLEAFRVK